ncbi:mCG141941 [Mus musculus]|nr:mCG141941 [Mus musculus]
MPLRSEGMGSDQKKSWLRASSLSILHKFQLFKQLMLVCVWPHLWGDGATELADEGELVLLCVTLHDRATSPHLCHDAPSTPEVMGGPQSSSSGGQAGTTMSPHGWCMGWAGSSQLG